MDGKKLFIYYSNTGNCQAVADHLAGHGFDTRRVEPVKDLPKAFFLKMLAGGFQAGLGKKAKLKAFDSELTGYDTVVIGSPIWNGRLATPVNTVIDRCEFTGKQLAFILCAGGGEAPKAVEKLKAAFPDAIVTVLRDPKSNPEELKKIVL